MLRVTQRGSSTMARLCSSQWDPPRPPHLLYAWGSMWQERFRDLLSWGEVLYKSKRMLYSFCVDCSCCKITIFERWDCQNPNLPIWGFISAALIISGKVFIRHPPCIRHSSLAARGRKGGRYKILLFQCFSSNQEDLMKLPRFTIWNSYCTDRYG